MKKIYVGNLPWSADDAGLRELFATVGEVQSVAVITDRETGRSRGFGFIEMNDADADKALADVNWTDANCASTRRANGRLVVVAAAVVTSSTPESATG